MKNTFFDPVDKQEVYDSVGYYLRSTNQKSGAPVLRTGKKGWYILNPDSDKVKQLMLEFTTSEEDEWMM